MLANLKHYQPDLRTVVPERLVGYSRLGPAVRRELIIAIVYLPVLTLEGMALHRVRQAPPAIEENPDDEREPRIGTPGPAA